MPLIVVAREDALVVASAHTRDADWRVTTHLRESTPLCVAADPNRPARLYCGTFGSGVWRSEDTGETWVWVGEGLPGGRITAIAVSPSEGTPALSVVYVGMDPTAIFRSSDGGDTWRERPGLTELPSASEWSFPPRPDTHHVRWIECDPARAGRIFVSVEAGATVRSPNGGNSWEDRTSGGPRDAHKIVTHPKAPGRLFVAAGDGCFESDDSGATWRRAEAGLADPYAWGLAVDPRDPGTAILSAAPGPDEAHDPRRAESRVYRRTGGGSWRPVTEGLPPARGTTAPILAASPFYPDVFYAACNRGVFRSVNGGRAWHRLEIPWPEEECRVRSLAVGP